MHRGEKRTGKACSTAWHPHPRRGKGRLRVLQVSARVYQTPSQDRLGALRSEHHSPAALLPAQLGWIHFHSPGGKDWLLQATHPLHIPPGHCNVSTTNILSLFLKPTTWAASLVVKKNKSLLSLGCRLPDPTQTSVHTGTRMGSDPQGKLQSFLRQPRAINR